MIVDYIVVSYMYIIYLIILLKTLVMIKYSHKHKNGTEQFVRVNGLRYYSCLQTFPTF